MESWPRGRERMWVIMCCPGRAIGDLAPIVEAVCSCGHDSLGGGAFMQIERQVIAAIVADACDIMIQLRGAVRRDDLLDDAGSAFVQHKNIPALSISNNAEEIIA